MAANIFDCVVLSGGGAKGSFGAGAAHALSVYYDSKSVGRTVCYLGASAGALNACALASFDSERLKGLWWDSVTNESVLGTKRHWLRSRFALQAALRRNPFSVFPNKHLRKLISQHVDFERLADKHLIILATNYTRGELKAFYVSQLVDDFVARDSALTIDRRRLSHFVRINSQEELVEVLLASAAIPVFFRPVRIGNDYYVDGGVGNNTPTREAAYFLRHLNTHGAGIPGDVYCIQQDPPAIITDHDPEMGFFAVLKRTVDVAGYLHIEPIIKAWNRINYEARKHEEKVTGFVDWLSASSFGQPTIDAVAQKVRADLGHLGGATARLEVPLIGVQPSTLLGDTLDFDQDAMRRNVRHGYDDMLRELEARGKISDLERRDLSNRQLG